MDFRTNLFQSCCSNFGESKNLNNIVVKRNVARNLKKKRCKKCPGER